MNKYELTNETIEFENKKLFRIRALKDFRYVKADDLIDISKELSKENE